MNEENAENEAKPLVARLNSLYSLYCRTTKCYSSPIGYSDSEQIETEDMMEKHCTQIYSLNMSTF